MPIQISDIDFPKMLDVTGQEVDISGFSDGQKQFYLGLFNEIISLYESKDKPRLIVGFGGPIGAGKTLISTLFKEIAKQIKLPFDFENVTIDAFHYPNDFLLSHTSSDGEFLKDHKGRFDTYNVDKLKNALRDFSKGEEVNFPIYSRKIHDPIENTIEIKSKKYLLLIEGLWLLSDEGDWKEIRQFLDLSYFIDADKDKVRDMVVSRHIKGGRARADAEKFYDSVDSKNFDAVEKSKSNADKIILPYYLV